MIVNHHKQMSSARIIMHGDDEGRLCSGSNAHTEKKMRQSRPRRDLWTQRSIDAAAPRRLQAAEERKRARVDRTSVLAAFCPREVLYRFQNDCKRLQEPLVMDAHECVVLWIDICKFTRLAENVSPEMLGHALTEVFTIIIELVTHHGGDVIKFCGDALLCTFRDAQNVYAQEDAGVDAAICAACKCAQAVQATPLSVSVQNNDQAPDGFTHSIDLQVKTCVAKGKIRAMLVGGAYDRWEYLVVGQPLQDLRAADRICEPSEIIVTQDVHERLLALAGPLNVSTQRRAAPVARANADLSREGASSIDFDLETEYDEAIDAEPSSSPSADMISSSCLLLTSSPQLDHTFSFTEMSHSRQSPKDKAVAACVSQQDARSPLALGPIVDGPQSENPRAWPARGNKMMLRRRPEPLLIPCTAEGLAHAPVAKTTQDKPPGALPARRNRCATTIDVPVPLQNVAAGFARRLSPRHQGFATCQARAKSNEFLPRWKPFGPSPRNASFQVANITPLGGTIGQSASNQYSEQDHFVLLGGQEWFEHKAPLLPSNSTLDLSAIHNAAATKAHSSPAEVNKTRSTDEEHPLAGFVPFQVRNRLACLETCRSAASPTAPKRPASPHSLAHPAQDMTFCSEAFWQDPSFAEMRHVTVLFIKLHGLSDRAFEEDDGTRLAKSIHKSLVVIQGSLYRYGGMLRQMLCDDKGTVAIGVFGVPGAPTSVAMRQDDVSYALVAALEIQRELAERRDILDCRASIGVATGPAFCGIIGSQQRAEYSIVGDTVNTAARIMEAIGADDSRYAVACDEQTRIDCRDSDMICFDDRMDLVEVKNKTKSVTLNYPRLLRRGKSSANLALELSSPAGPSPSLVELSDTARAPETPPQQGSASNFQNSQIPLVGQDLASAAIKSLLRSQSSFVHRHINQVMVLQGEAGAGKSALLQYARSQYKALVQKLEDSPEGPSASRSRGVQFYAVKCEAKENPLRAFFSQVLRAESPTWIADLVSVLKMRASSLLEYIELLADIFPEHRQAFTSFRTAAGHNPLWLAPGSTEREGALWAFLARLVQVHHVFRPGVLCVDDLHFAKAKVWRWFLVLVSTCCLRQVNGAATESPGIRLHTLGASPLGGVNRPARKQVSVDSLPMAVSQDIGKTRKSPSGSNKRELRKRELRKLKLSVDTSMDVMGLDESDAFDASLVMPQLLRVTTHKTSQDRRGSGISQRRRSCTGADAVVGVSPRAQPTFHAGSPLASAQGAGLDASRFSQKWNCTRRKRRSAVLGESGTPLSLTDALPRPDWIVLDNEDLDKAILSYGSEFGVFEAGPSTLLSVIFTASPSPHSPFEANFVSLLKRHHAMGRFPLRFIPVRPLGASEATLLATMLLRQSGYAGVVSEKSEALVKASCGNPARLFCLVREARSKEPDQHM